jgi:hypothetical protein
VHGHAKIGEEDIRLLFFKKHINQFIRNIVFNKLGLPFKSVNHVTYSSDYVTPMLCQPATFDIGFS